VEWGAQLLLGRVLVSVSSHNGAMTWDQGVLFHDVMRRTRRRMGAKTHRHLHPDSNWRELPVCIPRIEETYCIGGICCDQ